MPYGFMKKIDVSSYLPTTVSVEEISKAYSIESEPMLVNVPIIMLEYNNAGKKSKLGIDTDAEGIEEIVQLIKIRDLRKAGLDVSDGLGPGMSNAFVSVIKDLRYEISCAAIYDLLDGRYVGGVVVDEDIIMKMRPHESITVALVADAPVLVNPVVIDKLAEMAEDAEETKVPVDTDHTLGGLYR